MNITEKINSDKPTLVNFHATCCMPCIMMKPNIEEANETLGEKINYERIKWRQSGIFSASTLVQLVEGLLNN